jgi:hydrogenase maturation protease
VTARVLVAGVGNIFLGDDGFGVEVARRLTGAELPDGVQVGDYGTSGMHLAYDLADHQYDTTILVDTAPRGEPPGTLTVLEIRPEDRAEMATAGGPALFNGHGMQPEVVLGVLNMLGAEPGRILVVACEPAHVDECMGLSAPVAAAVDEAVALVTRLAREHAGLATPSEHAGLATPAEPSNSTNLDTVSTKTERDPCG